MTSFHPTYSTFLVYVHVSRVVMDIIIAVLNEIVMLVIVRVAKAEYEMKFASENCSLVSATSYAK